MNTLEVKEYLIDFQKRELPELTSRDMIVAESKKIKSIIGPRRAGKTYFLYQKIKELIAFGIKKENMLYLNLEDPKLIDINFKEIREIVKLHWHLYPSSTKGDFYIFIDEPQNIKNWEMAMRALHDEGFYIFISGSSSKLLSKEIATSLRGRTLSYMLLPFSFKEFLKLKNFSFNEKLGSKDISVILGLVDEYIKFGGFPEIISENSAETKMKIIDEYFNLVVYRDIVERYQIKNTLLIKWLIKSLITSFSKEFSVHKMFLTLKSQGIKVSKNTLYYYLAMLEDSFFVFFVPKFKHSIRKKDFSINKSYLCDIGFANLVGTANEGSKIENIIFLELKRRESPLINIYYWKNQQQEEVDFVVKKGDKVHELIQACSDLSDADVKKRELRALLKASAELKCGNLSVINYHYEAVEEHKGKKIKFILLWKWLLKLKS